MTDRRRDEERIERGAGGGAAVADLLARVRAAGDAAPAPTAPPRDAERPPDAELPQRDAERPRDLDDLAGAIAAAARRFVPDAAFDADTDFFDAGGSSVDAVELVAVLACELGVTVELDDVFADARPRRLAELALGAGASPPAAAAPPAPAAPPAAAPPAAAPAPAPAPAAPAPVAPAPAPAAPAPAPAAPLAAPADEDLAAVAADLARADALPFVGDPERTAPRRILLTGATGFLGSHLLLDLLRRGDAHVVCLVRARDDADAERRLGEGLRSFDVPWNAEVRRRVTALAGDVREPRLGLDGAAWERLAHEVDAIVGVAAAVDFLRGYRSLRQTNVLGPLALAELAMTGRPKPLHHISSIAVFNEVGIASMGEDDPVAHVDRLAAGYDRSKWAAEAALRRARDRGLVVTFLRPGGIGGHTHTGAYNARDLSCGFMSAFSRYRTVPAFRHLNVAPVDWVSRVAAAIVHDPDAWGLNYNLAGRPNTLPELVRDMELGGMNVEVLDWDGWRADFLARAEAEPVPELDFLVRVLRNPAAVKLCEATLLGPAATGERTEAFVARHRLPAPARYDARAQLRFYERLERDGLVRAPGRDDPPYLWFGETIAGELGGEPCELKLTLSIASMYQLVQERRIDVRGELRCALLHREPLTVETGDVIVRPDEGVPLEPGLEHPLLEYRLALRDRDGRAWWLRGRKLARPRRDWWTQARTLALEVGPDGGPATLAGVATVPARSYVREQIDGIEANPSLSSRERRLAKWTWLAWFGSQVGIGLAQPSLRAAAELLDVRRDAIDRGRP